MSGRKTILITGGAGFIGSSFVRHLFKKYPDYKIIVLDALTYAGNVSNFPEGAMESDRFEFWYGNVMDHSIVHSLVSRANIVVHFAAESHVTRSIHDNLAFFQTDVIGTQVVTNSVLKFRDQVELFVHISTSEVYGTAASNSSKMDEDHPLNPKSPYASAKCGADRLVYSYYETYQIPAVIVRPFNNYGPRQHLEKLIPRFITSCILKEPLTVHGDGSAVRDWIFVEDHCDALDRLIHADRKKIIGQVLNLGTGEALSILDIANRIKERMRSPDSLVEFVGNRPGQVFRHICDSAKARELLGWQPKTSFDEGLSKTIDWYLSHQSAWQNQVWMRHIPIITLDGRREMH